jgi:TRAP-type C4-dicarboxylate transport system permease small subunit
MDLRPDAPPTRSPSGRLGGYLKQVSIWFAYGGGVIVAGVGIMSAASIIGRSMLRRPITGDFELVEIATAVAGTLFLPYCQATFGNIVVDLFTLRASERVRDWLDRFGCLLMGIMFLVLGWRAAVGCIEMRHNGETSMLRGFPIWIGYAGMLPGVFVAGLVALAQSCGIKITEQAPAEQAAAQQVAE